MLSTIVLPYRIQGITVDLWGTLFFDSHYIDNLNFERALLLQEVFENVHYDFNTTPQIILNEERKRFIEYEMNGIFLGRRERLNYLTRYKLPRGDLTAVIELIDSFSSKYQPILNYELVYQLQQWKSKYKLALISNTGMISSDIIKENLKKIGIIELFDTIVFSEDIGFCKPHPDIFFEVSKRLRLPISNLLHLGDSYSFDYIAAQNAGYESILLKDGMLYGSWK